MRPILAASFATSSLAAVLLPAIAFAAAAAIAAPARAGVAPHTRYVELINRARDRVASFAIAAPGSGAFDEVSIGASLDGGGDSATVEVATDRCLHDLRFTFGNGRTLIYRDVDLCRSPRVRIRPLPHAGGPG